MISIIIDIFGTDLRKIIEEHFTICHHSLEIYGESCDEEMKPLYEYLKGIFIFVIILTPM
jgi:hypothetical protein